MPAVPPPNLIVLECDSYVVRQRRDKLVLEIRGAKAVAGLPLHRDYLTSNQVCERLGIPLRTLEKQRKQEHPIPVTYVGKVPRFVEEEIAEWAAAGRSIAARRAQEKFSTLAKPAPAALLFSGGRRKKLSPAATTLPHTHGEGS